MDEMEELRQEFLSEADELLILMEEEVLNLEKDPHNRESVNSIFRVAHTLKGGAAALELDRVSVFTHNLENLLDMVRDDKLAVDEELIDIILSSLDILKELIKKAALRQEAELGFEDETLEKIKKKSGVTQAKAPTPKGQPLKQETPKQKEPSLVSAPQKEEMPANSVNSGDFDAQMRSKLEKDFAIDEKKLTQIKEGFKKEERLFVVYVSFDSEYEMRSVSGIQTITAMKSIGEIIESTPPISVIMVEEFVPQVQFLFLTKSNSEHIYSKVYISDVLLDLEVEDVSYLFGGGETEEPVLENQNSVDIKENDLALLDRFPSQEITQEIKERIFSSLNQDLNVFQVRILINKNVLMRDVDSLLVLTTLEEVADIISAVPNKRDLQKDIYFPVLDIILETTEDAKLIKERAFIDETTLEIRVLTFQIKGETVTKVKENGEEVKETQKEQIVDESIVQRGEEEQTVSLTRHANESEDPHVTQEKTFSEKLLSKEEARIKGGGNAQVSAETVKTFLKVDSLRIDSLLNLVSELVITKAALIEIANPFIDISSEYKLGYQETKELIKAIGAKAPGLHEELSKVIGYLDFVSNSWKDVDKFENTVNAISRSINELQEGIMKIRMVPIGSTFTRFTRMIRDVSKQLNKEVTLTIIGEDTELDKSVIEELADPLMHMVRNSIDHGIETPDVRLKNGKSKQGNITLAAHHEGNIIRIDVIDDGAGLDTNKIHAKAVEKGLISASQSLSKDEILHLILLPGFSTADKVTDLSGRGVGMDVVRRNIEELSGTLTIASELGKGSTMTIKIPLTLSIIQALIVKINGFFFSIPLSVISETVPLDKKALQKFERSEITYINDEMVTIINVKSLFNIRESRADRVKRFEEEMSELINTELLDESIAILEKSDFLGGLTPTTFTPELRQSNFNMSQSMDDDDGFLVVVTLGNKKIGLLVDSIVAEQDIVIKPLHKLYGTTKGVSGATILGDGSISLILDVAQITELYVKRDEFVSIQ
jgi:two-component system chemotaxis sensor kinase CheA